MSERMLRGICADRYAPEEASILDASGSTTEATIHAYFFAWYATRAEAMP